VWLRTEVTTDSHSMPVQLQPRSESQQSGSAELRAVHVSWGPQRRHAGTNRRSQRHGHHHTVCTYPAPSINRYRKYARANCTGAVNRWRCKTLNANSNLIIRIMNQHVTDGSNHSNYKRSRQTGVTTWIWHRNSAATQARRKMISIYSKV
jgi:hypothetical protein